MVSCLFSLLSFSLHGMNIQLGDESMPLFHHLRPGSATRVLREKPGGARILSFFLRVIVMVVALALFFLFAGIAVFVLIVLCVIGRVLRRQQVFHTVIIPPEVDRRGLTPEDMRLLPSFSYTGGIPAECVVCLERIREGECCRALPECSHVFHRPCVDRWLERSHVCPICRGGVAVKDDEAEVLEIPLECN